MVNTDQELEVQIPDWYDVGMDQSVKNRIAELRTARGWSQQKLADSCKPPTSQPTIKRLESGVMSLTQEWMSRLATALSSKGDTVNPADLLPSTPKTGGRMLIPNDIGSKPLQGSPDDLARPGKKDLPILGHARGGEEGFFMDQGRIHGVTERPGILEGVPDAYAVRVHDHSMGNVLRHGFLCHVDPHRPPAPGDEVVIQLADGQAFIKTLVRRTAKHIRCKQYNPEKEIDYPTEGTIVHLIVGSTRIRD